MKKRKTSLPIDPLDVFDPARWGLCLVAILDLGVRLYRFWERYRHVFVSRTRDTSANAYLYLRGVLTLERERNFKNMARRLGNGEDGQALQHFMPTSAILNLARVLPLDDSPAAGNGGLSSALSLYQAFSSQIENCCAHLALGQERGL